MDSRFNNSPSHSQREEPVNNSEKGPDSLLTGVVEGNIATTRIASPRKRRAVQKRVVSVPIADLDGSRIKGEGAPPSDSWTWRKYGQKPIKGSPYPRGYYRCSSSKGCLARKQVERSRVDPTMLVVTYACDHNHPWPTSRSQHQQRQQEEEITMPAAAGITTTTTATTSSSSPSTSSIANAEAAVPSTPKLEPEEPMVFGNQAEIDQDEKFTDLREEPLMTATEDFNWFADMVSSSTSTILDSPFCMESTSGRDAGMAMLFPMGEEDELLYADLGELPEYSLVFRRSGVFERDEERQRCGLRVAPLCGSSG